MAGKFCTTYVPPQQSVLNVCVARTYRIAGPSGRGRCIRGPFGYTRIYATLTTSNSTRHPQTKMYYYILVNCVCAYRTCQRRKLTFYFSITGMINEMNNNFYSNDNTDLFLINARRIYSSKIFSSRRLHLAINHL